MNKLKIIALLAVPAAYLACRVSWEGSIIALEELYPDVDQTTIRKIHREMVKESLTGKYDGIDINAAEDARMEAIFREKLAKLNS